MGRLSASILVTFFALAVATGALAAPAEGFLEQYAATYRFRHGQPTSVTVTPDGREVLFLRSGPRSFVRDLYAFDVASGAERVLLTAEQILEGAEESLTAEEKARRERQRLAARGIAGFGLSNDGRRVLVPLSGRLFVVDRDSRKVRELESAAGAPVDPRFSPDGSKVAAVRGGDLYVLDVAAGTERRLTTSASETLESGLAEFVAQEEMGRYEGYWWAPDGGTIAYQETDTASVERLYIGDPFTPEQAPQPWVYPRAGRANAKVRLGLVPVAGGATTWVRWDADRYPYLASVRWQANAPLTILVQNRTQTEELLLAVDPANGDTRTLHVERDRTWLNLDPDLPRWLPSGEGFLWSTERDGGWALELRDRTGGFVRTVVPVESGYRAFLRVDERRGVVYVLASPDPTEEHVLRASLREEGGEPRRLTAEPGVHTGVFAESGADVWVHTVQRPDGSVDTVVRRLDGREVGPLRSVTERPPFAPNLEITSVEVDGRRHYAALVRPRDFDERRRYPVIVYVYGGPHWNVVSTAGQRFLLHQWIADHGYVVVSIDGRGTPGRGRVWERALAFAEGVDGPRGDIVSVPLEDQAAVLKALGERSPELDLARVGVFGWSYGGTMAAMAVLRRPDVFRAAVAVAPVNDWRDYDTHYTERYLGLPDDNPAGYDRSAAATWAEKLDRPLLLMHGTADDNVYFFHSLKLVNALFRAGRPFEFVPLVGFTHSVPDPLMTVRIYDRLVAFFDERLRAPEE